jgi:hypothetical protein
MPNWRLKAKSGKVLQVRYGPKGAGESTEAGSRGPSYEARSVMSSPRIRLWWRSLGRTYVNTEFAQFVDDLIESPPAADDWATITRWSDQR